MQVFASCARTNNARPDCGCTSPRECAELPTRNPPRLHGSDARIVRGPTDGAVAAVGDQQTSGPARRVYSTAVALSEAHVNTSPARGPAVSPQDGVGRGRLFGLLGLRPARTRASAGASVLHPDRDGHVGGCVAGAPDEPLPAEAGKRGSARGAPAPAAYGTP
ncbi:hypothetical protein AcW1_001478 [Taiwanofungus camphoratus]|nr:hypothetical protein AcW1_001478 [Antrodia cinnamomea]